MFGVLIIVALTVLFRIGVAFTGSNGDTMEIKTFGKFEKYVTPCITYLINT